MKREPDYYGIEIRNTSTQNFEMYPVLFTVRKSCEECIEFLNKVPDNLDPVMVEIWDPDRTQAFKEDGVPVLKMKGATEISTPLEKDPIQDWINTQIEDRIKSRERDIEWWYKHYPWLVPYIFPGLNPNKVYVSNPGDANEAKPWFGVLDPDTGKPLSPTFKCEVGDGSEYPCTMDSFATC